MHSLEIIRSMHFIPFQKIENNFQNYKVWSPNIFQYRNHVERLNQYFKFEDKKIFCASTNLLYNSLSIYMYMCVSMNVYICIYTRARTYKHQIYMFSYTLIR
jgi:hypothetical protein